MHVLCPSCEAEYEIPSLRRPRTLRCARCASEWRVMPEPEPALAGAAAMPAAGTSGLADPAEQEAPPGFSTLPGQAMPVEAEPSMPAVDAAAAGDASPTSAPLLAERPLVGAAARALLSRGDAVLGLLWLLTAVLIAAALWAGWHWRLPIQHGWPPSLRLYRLLPHGVPGAAIGHPPPLARIGAQAGA